MASSASQGNIAVSACDYLDFLFDSSGWESVGAGSGPVCAKGRVGGCGALAAIMGTTNLPMSADALRALEKFVDSEPDTPFIFVVQPYEVADGPEQTGALSRVFSAMVRRRKRSAVIAVVLGELIGPAAMLARLADMICFGPGASLTLADVKTSRRILSPNGSAVPVGLLSRTSKTDAAALLAARRIVSRLSAASQSRPRTFTADAINDAALEHLAGSDKARHVDERRLLRRLTDDRTYVEFDSSGGLTAFLAEIGGRIVGVLANGAPLSGVLDANALAHANALVGFCGRHALPVVTLIDCPGVVPDEASLGSLSDLIATWEDSGIPVVSVVIRRAIGAASAALMPSFATVLHWPDAAVGLLKNTAGDPEGRMIAARETRAAIIETLASRREGKV